MKVQISTETTNKICEILKPLLFEMKDFNALKWVVRPDKEIVAILTNELVQPMHFGIFELIFKSCFVNIFLQTNIQGINDDVFMLIIEYKYQIIPSGSNGNTIHYTIQNGKII